MLTQEQSSARVGSASLQDKRQGNPKLKLQLPSHQVTDLHITPKDTPSSASPDANTNGTKTPQNPCISNASTIALETSTSTGLRLDGRIDSLQSIPPPPPKRRTWKHKLPRWLRSTFWIRNNIDWNHLKPVLRSAVSAWICLLLLLIPTTLRMIGQGGFIILIAAFLTPPADPFAAVLERETLVVGTVSIMFAWSCLGIKVAHFARRNVKYDAEIPIVLTGRYMETGPSIICASFLVVGTSVLLFVRARRVAQFPFTFAVILSCICMDISLTVAPMFPYPYYSIGTSIYTPILLHSLIALLSSLFILPDSTISQFGSHFGSALAPLILAIRMQPNLLATPPGQMPNMNSESEHEGPGAFRTLVQASEGALAPLAGSSRLMRKSVVWWSRFAPGDFGVMHEMLRRLSVRANGMAFYFRIMDPARHKFPGTVTPMPSPNGTPGTATRMTTRSHTPTVALSRTSSVMPTSPDGKALQSRRYRQGYHYFSRSHRSVHGHHHHQRQHHHHHTPISLPFFHSHHASTLLQEALSRSRSPTLDHSQPQSHEGLVGVFESQRYLNLETRFAHPDAEALLGQMMSLLNESVGDLLETCASAMEVVGTWFGDVGKGDSWSAWMADCWKVVKGDRPVGDHKEEGMAWGEVLVKVDETREKLEKALDEFRSKKRHRVLEMYRSAVDPNQSGTDEVPPHRYLFQCYLYQYHLMQFATHLRDMLDEIIRLENTRRHRRLWFPPFHIMKHFSYSRLEPSDDHLEGDEDEDPNIIPGIDLDATPPTAGVNFGLPRRRNPDALPPADWLEVIGEWTYYVLSGLGRGNAVFAIKAGIMTAALSLPSFISSSAGFAFRNRSVWAMVMGQTTITRFRGDTGYGLVSRTLTTFFGGLVGMVIWYASAGNGNGNPYALVALAALCFPPFLFIRLYTPTPTMTVVIFFMTTQLVLGYSWQDMHLPPLSVAGKGFEVAWKRFLLVTIGVTTAYLFSLLPPATTIRRYLRTTYATTAAEVGQLYCDVVSFASNRSRPENEQIVKNLMAIRMKLKRSMGMRQNVAYEFSIRGKWPAERYKRILELQMEIAYLLSHLRSVIENLEPSWSKAFLRRTRFLDSDFQGDVLAIISMVSTSLRTGTPLPQVTPCPILDRFVLRHHGLHIVDEDAEDDYGLPRTLTIETLEDEQYLCFCVGVTTAFGIMTRLDRLMFATKELVGEQYYIHGLMSTHV